jgi:hypothetical protein
VLKCAVKSEERIGVNRTRTDTAKNNTNTQRHKQRGRWVEVRSQSKNEAMWTEGGERVITESLD